MTISTYTELQTAILDWSHRSDNASITAKIPDFIRLAESRINRVLDFNEEEMESDLTATIGSRFINIPNNFIRPIALWFTYYNPRESITYVDSSLLPLSVSSGIPDYWTIDGDKMAFDSAADKAYTYTFRYAVKVTLSDSNVTNWILDNHPDVYLYASLMELCAFTQDNEQLGIWTQAYELAMSQVKEIQHRTKSMSTLATDINTIRSRPDIYEGY